MNGLQTVVSRRERIMTPTGVNIFGYAFAESGVGEITRQLVAVVEHAGYPFSVIPFTFTPSRQQAEFANLGSPEASGDINIVSVNADEFPRFVQWVGAPFLASRYTIGIWAWETEEFPEIMIGSGNLVDEVWGISEFAARAIRQKIDRPVFSFPLPVAVPPPPEMNRADLGFSNRFMFLFCFDYDSVFERKNPVGLVEAYRQAFDLQEDAQLVIKSVNGDRHPRHHRRLLAAAKGRADVSIVDGYWPASHVKGLMAEADAYVSLHRSEGFGLTLAEAMALEKPVIGTGYSGNLDFMVPENSFLIPFDRVQIPAGCDPYPAGSWWAEPRTEAAAEALRRVRYRPAEAARKSRRAAADIRRSHGPQARVAFLRERIDLIEETMRKENKTRAEAHSPAPEEIATDSPVDHALINATMSRLESQLESGPDLQSSSRFGRLGLWLRRTVFRVLRNYHVHQVQLGETLVDILRLQNERIESLTERLHRAEAHLAAKTSRETQIPRRSERSDPQ